MAEAPLPDRVERPEPDETHSPESSGAGPPSTSESVHRLRRRKSSSREEVRLLRRSRDERLIAGVAGGLGRYLRVDPVLVRIAFVILAIAGGSGFLLYVIGALVIPEEKPSDRNRRTDPAKLQTLRQVAGWTLVAFGGILLIDRYVPEFGRIIWPVLLLAIGFAVLVQASRKPG